MVWDAGAHLMFITSVPATTWNTPLSRSVVASMVYYGKAQRKPVVIRYIQSGHENPGFDYLQNSAREGPYATLLGPIDTRTFASHGLPSNAVITWGLRAGFTIFGAMRRVVTCRLTLGNFRCIGTIAGRKQQHSIFFPCTIAVDLRPNACPGNGSIA